MRYVDTHCHLDSEVYERDLDVVVKHAREEGVAVITLGSDLASSRKAVALAEKYPDVVWAAVGLHPLKVPSDMTADDKLMDVGAFNELLKNPKVVAIGETGLDYHALNGDVRDQMEKKDIERARANQRKVFGRFLGLSREHRLPLLLHCRDAHDVMLEMLETWDKASAGFDARGVVHCFSGDWRDARRYFNLDFSVSVTGIMSHGGHQEEIIKKTPANRLLVESDCPHMTRVPWAIRRNEPSYLPVVADAVAAMRGVAADQFAAETTANAMRVFKRMNAATDEPAAKK